MIATFFPFPLSLVALVLVLDLLKVLLQLSDYPPVVVTSLICVAGGHGEQSTSIGICVIASYCTAIKVTVGIEIIIN